ncbi:hypothetical protein RJ035_001146 [Blastomyces gilchristii]
MHTIRSSKLTIGGFDLNRRAVLHSVGSAMAGNIVIGDNLKRTVLVAITLAGVGSRNNNVPLQRRYLLSKRAERNRE